MGSWITTVEFSAGRNPRRNLILMKKFMTVLLGMSLVIGSAALAFGDDPKPATSTDTSSKKKKKGKKKSTTTTTTPSTDKTTPPAK
jgi:hypothetical protein